MEAEIGEGGFIIATWLFLRALGLIYFAAFASLRSQILGLVGRDGLLPAESFLEHRSTHGWRRFVKWPTVFWWNSSNLALRGACTVGMVLSVLLVFGVAPLPVLTLLWALYLSLVVVCRLFLGYQWDVLLLEAGFLAIFLAPWTLIDPVPAHEPPRLVLWLLWWLLFRLVFSSGVVKLRSGDRSWRDLTALCYHFETQPLPTRVAWYFHQMPRWFQRLSCALTFLAELAAPLLIFAPSPFREAGAAAIIILMVLILLTGNYAFFNWLTIALCLLLFHDGWYLDAGAAVSVVPVLEPMSAPWPNWLLGPIAAVLGFISIDIMLRLFRISAPWPRPLMTLLRVTLPFYLVNPYGLFAVMTRKRPEIVIEGSVDGEHWVEYPLKWKPGDPSQAPRFVAPHQPRLDWQLWFAALGTSYENPWVYILLTRIRQRSPSVLALLGKPPSGPKMLYWKASLYEYHFTRPAERKATGNWWKRTRLTDYA